MVTLSFKLVGSATVDLSDFQEVANMHVCQFSLCSQSQECPIPLNSSIFVIVSYNFAYW